MSGDPRFAGTIKITTNAVIDNRANLNYLLTHSGLDYKCNILNDRNPVVTEDVEGDKKIYNAEVAEWDKLRQRLLAGHGADGGLMGHFLGMCNVVYLLGAVRNGGR